jgi:hypothetical protein
VTVTVGACSYQLAISDDTFGPELKSTRSQPVPDQVCTAYPSAGTAVTSVTVPPDMSSVTVPPASV